MALGLIITRFCAFHLLCIIGQAIKHLIKDSILQATGYCSSILRFHALRPMALGFIIGLGWVRGLIYLQIIYRPT